MARQSGVRSGHSSVWPLPRALVVSDEPPIIDLLQLGLGYEGFDVSVATTRVAALRSARRQAPDLMLLDAALCESAADELPSLLRAEAHDAAILLLGAQDPADEESAPADTERGVDDAVRKPFTFRELMAHVRPVLQRRGKIVAGCLSFEDVTLDRGRHLVTRGEQAIELTLREFELLDLFLRHPEQVLSRPVILTHIWGSGFAVSDNVLDVYVHLLRRKLGDRPPRLIRTVRGVGYALRATR